MIARPCRIVLIVVLLLAVPLFAAKFWETKEFTKWTEKECKELLTKSPWAFSNGFGERPVINVNPKAEIPEDRAGAQRAEIQPIFGEGASTLVFEFRILTAKPVRMALAQLQMLRRPDDAVLRARTQQYIESDPGKEVVIQVGYHSEPAGSQATLDAHSYFLHAGLINFRNNTYLATDRNANIAIMAYRAPHERQPNAELVFPRFDDKGAPHFTGEEKFISLRSEFTPDMRGQKRKYDIFVKMNPKNMVFRDAFTF